MSIIVLETKDDISYEEICALTVTVGWATDYFTSMEHFQYTLNASRHVVHLRDNGHLVGFGRIVEDGINCMFYDICIHPNYQGHHLGTLIMEHLISKIKNQNFVSIGLFCEEDNKTVHEFYNKFGFEPVEGMELRKYMRANWENL